MTVQSRRYGDLNFTSHSKCIFKNSLMQSQWNSFVFGNIYYSPFQSINVVKRLLSVSYISAIRLYHVFSPMGN